MATGLGGLDGRCVQSPIFSEGRAKVVQASGFFGKTRPLDSWRSINSITEGLSAMARSKKSRRKAKGKARKANRPVLPISQQAGATRFRPIAFAGEPAVDRAVFQDDVLKHLEPEVAAEVWSVRSALDLAAEGEDAGALLAVQGIPRRSPVSDWRLLVRGLIDWYGGDFTAAAASWQRLEAGRRPARIAATLMAAGGDAESAAASKTGVDYVRKLRVERPALAEAKATLSRPDRCPDDGSIADDDFVSPERVGWFCRFSSRHRRQEPELVRAIGIAIVARVQHCAPPEVLDIVLPQFDGPAHDPKHELLRYAYYRGFEDADVEVAETLRRYLRQLPKLEGLPEERRRPLEAAVHFKIASRFDRGPVPSGVMGMLASRGQAENREAAGDHYREAVKLMPGFADGHEAYVAWIRGHAENEAWRKAAREPYEAMLPEAMANWSAGVPEAIEPRLYLVDYLLDEERTEEAIPHVEFLKASRHPDPRVRSIEWKWHVLEAMRLARRKTRLAAGAEMLDAAERLWPASVDRDWLPYLRAAVALRAKDGPRFEALRQEARASLGTESDFDLIDAALMLGAAQRMRVPAADLKPLRKPVDDAAGKLERLATPSLLASARPFLQLIRSGLIYPAYRMHGSKFAAELIERMHWDSQQPYFDALSDQELKLVGSWLQHHRQFKHDTVRYSVPHAMRRLAQAPFFIAVRVEQVLQSRFRRPCNQDLESLRNAVPDEADPFLRHWYRELVDQAEKRPNPEAMFERLGSFLERMFGDEDDEGWDRGNARDDEVDEDDAGSGPELVNAVEEAVAGRAESGRAESGRAESLGAEARPVMVDMNQDPQVIPPEPRAQTRFDPSHQAPNWELRERRPKDPLKKRKQARKQR